MLNNFLSERDNRATFYLFHAAAGAVWGATLVMVHISITAEFWTINAFLTLAWAVLIQGSLVLFYRKEEHSILKGMALVLATMVTILAGIFIIVPY